MSESETPQQKPTVGSVVKRILRIALVTYLLVLLLLTFLQRQMLYHPRRARQLKVAEFRDVMQVFPESTDVELICDDGVGIRAWLLRKTKGSDSVEKSRRPLILFFHGNAGNRAGRVNWYRLFEQAGADVLAIDYHGYGDSGGKMSEGALEQDCDAAWEFATMNLGYRPEDIVVVGTSLGGAAAVYVSSRTCAVGNGPGGLAVVATFSSMVDVAGSLYPWLPVQAVLVDRYPSAERIQNVTSRLVVLHGDQDTLVQPRFGRKLFDAAPDISADGIPKNWVNLPDVGHNDILGGGRQIILGEITALVAAAAGSVQ